MKTQLKSLLWLLLMSMAAMTNTWAAVPAAPKGFTADAKGSPSTITLQWTAATGLTSYELDRSTDNRTFNKIADPDDNASSYQDTPLQPNTTYYYKLYAVNKDGRSTAVDASAKTAAPLAKPAVPTKLNANPTVTQIDFSWEAGSGGGAPASFDWQCSTDKTFAKVDKSGNTTQKSVIIPDLNAGTLYYLRVQAKNATDVSGWSSLEKSTQNVPKPNTPANFKIDNFTQNVINVAWDAVGGAEGYEVRMATNSGFSPLFRTVPLNSSMTTASLDNLAPATLYYMQVRAKNTVSGITAWSDWSGTKEQRTTEQPVLGVPINLDGIAISTSQIDFKWSSTSVAIAGESFYWQCSTDKTFGKYEKEGNSTATNVSVMGLNAGTKYYFRVRAKDKTNESNWSGWIDRDTKAPDKPAAPTNLRTNNLTYNLVDLAWDNTVSDAKPTEIERKVGTGNFGLIKSVDGNVLTLKDSDVQPRITYTYRVRNIKGGIASDYSNEKTVTTPAPPVPSNVVATQTGVNATGKPIFKITWTNNWPNATVFEVQRSESQNTGYGKIDRNDFGNQFIDEINTECGKTYYYRVIANAGLTDSDPSAASNAVNRECPAIKPAAPTNLKASDGTALDKIDLSWESNEQNIVEFELQRKLKTEDDTKWVTIAKPAASSRAYTDPNLCPSKSYTYRIRVNKANNNNSDYGNVDEGSTPSEIHSLLTATAVSSTQVDIKWGYITATYTIKTFQIKYGKTAEPNVTTTVTVAATDRAKSITLLSPNTEYTFEVGTNLESCATLRYKSVSAKTLQEAPKLAAPTNLVATTISDTQIDLAWKDNEQNEEFFAWEISTDNSTWKSDGLPKNATSFSVKNLQPNTKYFFRVRCTVQQPSIYYSDYSNIADATTKTSPVTIPNAPTSLTAAASGSDKIVLNWTDNANNESGFDIERATSEAGPFAKIGEVNTDIKTYTDSGLSASTTYCYQVKAKNSTGGSAYSNKSCAKTDAPAVTIPNAPTSLTAAASGSDKIVLNWTDNANNESGFDIERATSEAGPFAKIGEVNTDIKTYTDSGLSASTTYCYQVKAKNSAGGSAYSNKSCAKTDAINTPVTTLAAPKNLRQDLSKTSINQASLIWENVATNATGIEIWRSVGDESNWKLYEAVNASPVPSAYTDKSVRTGNKYFYRVRSTRTSGDPSDWSNTINLLAPVVNSIDPNTEIIVYPNPFSNEIKVNMSDLTKTNINIYSNAGVSVFEKLVSNQLSQSIDLQQLPAGIYWLTLTNESKKQTFKIIKQ
jgi:Secretion system C-terminal sorting domain/Fibronectin type III domain